MLGLSYCAHGVKEMALDRRKFFKIAGLSSLVGLMGKQSFPVGGESESKYSHGDEQLHGERWAMVIDLKKCKNGKGCDQDCKKACHVSHNVPSIDEPKHEIKWIWLEEYDKAFPTQENEFINQELLHSRTPVLCNHCANPPCVKVCPTQATWKREDGIVMMDWHRCIGCRYCVAACPYGSRSFNWFDPVERNENGNIEKEQKYLKTVNPVFPTRSKGVVEKCTFCDERLARGQQPACVEACKEGAMIFGDLEEPESEIRKILNNRFSIRRKPGLGTQPQIYYLI